MTPSTHSALDPGDCSWVSAIPVATRVNEGPATSYFCWREVQAGEAARTSSSSEPKEMPASGPAGLGGPWGSVLPKPSSKLWLVFFVGFSLFKIRHSGLKKDGSWSFGGPQYRARGSSGRGCRRAAVWEAHL